MRSQSGQSRHVRSRQAGFTLVELLVVIGIIAVLISILLPSLAKARSAALKVACAANMRSIGQMFQIYESSNRGRWPLARNAGWDWGNHNTYVCGAIWPHALSPSDEPTNTLPGWTADDYDKHVANMKAFVCPAQAQDPDIQRTYVLMGATHFWGGECCRNMVYGYLPVVNQQVCATSRTPCKFRSSETIMMGEMKVGGPANDWITNVNDKYHIGGNFATVSFDEFTRDDCGIWGPWAHDMEGANYLFCDGHVEYQQSPVRYHAGVWQGNFDNTTDGTPATVAWAKQFNVDKSACPDWGSGWWSDLPTP